MKLYDQNGDECQMTGLPHMFYDKVAVEDLVRVKDARIAELERENSELKRQVQEWKDWLAGACI